MVELAAPVAEDRIERIGLRRGARIAVEDHRDVAAKLVEPLADQPRDDRIGDEFAGVHHRLGLEADRGSRLDRGAQHVARRELHPAMLLPETRRLRSLPRPRRAQPNDVQTPRAPGFPQPFYNTLT